jgi:ATP-dependent DNA helicase RecG
MRDKEIEKLIKKGESRNLEFKESLSVRDEIGESISAFSNSCNGKILIGISNSGEIKGVQIGEKTIEGLANFIKQNTDNSIYPDIKVEKINNKNIIIIEVKEADEKPVFFRGKAYKRIGNSNHKLSASEIRKLAKESTKSYWDEQICEEASLEDIDKEKVRVFLKEAKKQRDIDIEEETDTKEALMRLKLLKNEKLTNASVLLFAKEPQKFFLQAEVKCIRFKGNDVTGPMIDMKVISEDIINQLKKAEDFIFEHIPMAAWIEELKIQRQEKWLYPPKAIREALANALAHRDYCSASKIQIRIFDDRTEFWNPGNLPEGWTVKKLKQKHESKPKNPLIAKQFFLIKYIEEVGTGTNKIIEWCKEWGLPEPEFEFTGSSIIVTFRKHALTKDYLSSLGLNERQKKAIEYIEKYNRITNKEYQELNNVSNKTAYQDLFNLLKRQMIEKVGAGKYVYYVLRVIQGNAKVMQKEKEEK